MIKSGREKGYTRNLLLAATIASLSSTMIMQTPVKAETLAEAIANTATQSYTLTDNYTFTSNAGALAGSARTFTIDGQNLYSISGNNQYNGIEVSSGQALTIKDVIKLQNFKKEAGHGGAIYNTGTITLGDGVQFIGNTAYMGGAIANEGENASISLGNNVLFKNNYITGHGSAIYNKSGYVEIGDGLIITKDELGSYHDCGIYSNEGGTIKIGNNANISNFRKAIVVAGSGELINIGDNFKILDSMRGLSIEGNGVAIGVIGKNAEFLNNIDRVISINDSVLEGTSLTVGDGLVVKDNTNVSPDVDYCFGTIYNGTNSEITFLGTSFFESNSVQRTNADGGALKNLNKTTFKGDTVFTGNSANGAAGALSNKGANSILDFQAKASFSENKAVSDGGAIFNEGTITFKDIATFKNNIAGANKTYIEDYWLGIFNADGVDLYLNPAADTGTYYILALNGLNTESTAKGGAIYNAKNITFSAGADFEGNKTGYGGAIYNDSTGTILFNDVSKYTFKDNIANFNGGAIYNNGGTITLGNTTFSSNLANGKLNGIYNNNGTINIANGATVTINDGYDGSNSGVLNIGSSSASGSILNLNINNGELQTNNLGTVTNNGTINFGLDVDLTNSNSDKLVITSLSENQSIIISAINLMTGTGSDVIAVNLTDNDDLKTIYSLSNDIKKHITKADGVTYNVRKVSYDSSNGNLMFNQMFLADEVHADDIAVRTYTMTDDETVAENMGALADYYETKADLTINGASKKIIGGSYTGITVNEGQTLRVNNVADVTGFSDDIFVTNNGTLELSNSKSSSKILGTGATSVKEGTVILGNTLAQKDLTIKNAAELQINASNLGITNAISNEGTITLTGGALAKTITISGSGSTVINGSVTNNAKISNAVTINAGKDLTSNADNITNTVANSGDYNVTGGTISNAVTGNGNANIQGDTTVNAAIEGNVNVNENKKLTVDSSTPLTGAASIALNNGSTLDISGDTSTGNTYNNISVASGTANLEMDWGDVISTNNINGKLNISSIDLTATNDLTPAYTLATGSNLNNVSIANNVNLITNDTSFNTVKYSPVATLYATAGSLTGSRSDLAEAVNTTKAAESVIYSMSADEKAGATSPGTLGGGNLIVQGNGKTIKDEGIIVGDGVNSANLTLKDTNMNIEGNALEINTTSNVTLQAETKDMTIEGDIISHDANNTITFAGNKTIKFNGLFDPAQAIVDGATVVRGGNDDNIQWTITNGTLRYLDDAYLNYNPLNSITLNGGTLDTRNGVVTDFTLANFNVNANSNVMLDVDLANKKMDNFDNSTIAVTGGAKLNVSALNLISDATSDNTQVKFTSNANLIGNVNYTGSAVLTALAPIYKYNVEYDDTDGTNGYFNFARFNSGDYGDYNPAVLATPVAAQLGGYLIQLNSYDEAFRNMDMYMLMTKDQRQAMKLRNKYADLNAAPVYDDTKAVSERAAGWFRPFVNFESVELKNGPKVKNNIYGTFAGFDSGITELSNGWDGMWGIYAGYNGSHQHYDGIGIYQNGGTLGLTGMLYKDNFFTGLTANVGANAGNASTMYGHDDFAMLMTGVASKTGYNWELADGKFIIQPSYQMSYSLVNTFDYTNSAGVRVKSDPLHAITFEPGVKFIGNLPHGWQPYMGVSVVWNVLDKTDVKANDVSLPNMSVKPFVKYGVGVRKTWGDRLTGFLQTFITNGGRNGIGFQAGFKWTLGKSPEKSIKKTQSKPIEKQQTKIT